MSNYKLEKEIDKLIRSACRGLIKEREFLVELLIEVRCRITLECYGRKPSPETVETMKKIKDYLGD